MKREYYKWYSPSLGKEMELLVFGHSGTPVIIFPTRCGRFYDYENWRVLENVSRRIDSGEFQFYCVDSVDRESFYCDQCPSQDKIVRHMQYEKYVLQELVPLVQSNTGGKKIISAGCSMGAYHAVNLAFRYPWLFCKVIGMSGRYDLTFSKGTFKDLFDGYWDQDVYFNMPTQYISNLTDAEVLSQIQALHIILTLGSEDCFLENNFLLSDLLNEKNIDHELYIWEKEAHKPWYWRQMLELYL